MTPMDFLHAHIKRALCLTDFAYARLDTEAGATDVARLREQYHIPIHESLADGLYDRGVLGWLASRVLDQVPLFQPCPGADAAAWQLADPDGPRSVVVGHFDFATASRIRDEGERAAENAVLDDLIRELVTAWLSEDLGVDTTHIEIRLHEFEPGEIRVYA